MATPGETLGRLLAVVLPLAALLAGLLGVAEGVSEPALTGVTIESSSGLVLSVDPASLAWAAGIRPGDSLVARTEGIDPAGWSIQTERNGAEQALTERAATATARLGLLFSLAAVGFGVAGLAFARQRRRWAEWCGALGLCVASIPFATVHDLALDPIVAALALASGWIWLARWYRHRRVALAGLFVAVMVVLAAALARLVDSDLVAVARDAEFALTIATIGFLLAANVTSRDLARLASSMRRVDLAFVATALVTVAAIQGAASPPIWVPILALGAALVAYAWARGLIASWIDRVIYAEARERATIDAAELERARLSRELHDDPLQALVGVIMRLEDRPDTEPERASLRAIAAQLRSIATTLHPPVLDDLGLVPAVEAMFADGGPIPVDLEIARATGYGATERPPFEVELATYRIIQEAATNAIRHSGCQRISVRGQVAPRSIAIDVLDDGRGIAEHDIERAMREGHLGVASMRRRAEAIDAELIQVGTPGAGTRVSLRWSE